MRYFDEIVIQIFAKKEMEANAHFWYSISTEKEVYNMLEQFNCPYSLEEFTNVPEPRSNFQELRLSFSKNDQLSQNPAFQKALEGIDTFRLRISPDGRTLLLFPEGPYNMTFTSKGVRTHHPLGRILRQQGLEMPISFRVIDRKSVV